MKRKSSLVKFILVLALVAIGIFASFACITYKSPGGNVWNFNGFLRGMSLDIDLGGGITAVYEARGEKPDDSDMNGAVSRLRNMLSVQEYDDATAVREGSHRIRVRVPGVYDPDEIFTAVDDPAKLEFYLSEDSVYSENDSLIFTGDVITDASAGYAGTNGYVVNLTFDEVGATTLENVTKNNIDSFMIICEVEDGEVSSPLSVAQIGETLTGGQMSITGSFTAETAQEMADRIMSGTFDISLALVSCEVVSAESAAEARTAGLIACLTVLVLAVIFMCAFYRMMGMVAGISALVYSVLTLFLLAVFPPVQLTVSGIAGIILAFVLTMLGSAITFGKIGSEYRNGKSVLAAYFTGVKKALPPIVDINVAAALVAILLLIFGTGSVSAFGLVFLIGALVSMFTSLLVTRFMLKWTIAIWGANDPRKYALKRRPGFNEADEEEYVPAPKREKRKDRVVTESGIAVEIDPEEAAASEEAQSPAGNAPKAGKSGENFDDIFGSFDGGEKK